MFGGLGLESVVMVVRIAAAGLGTERDRLVSLALTLGFSSSQRRASVLFVFEKVRNFR